MRVINMQGLCVRALHRVRGDELTNAQRRSLSCRTLLSQAGCGARGNQTLGACFFPCWFLWKSGVTVGEVPRAGPGLQVRGNGGFASCSTAFTWVLGDGPAGGASLWHCWHFTAASWPPPLTHADA